MNGNELTEVQCVSKELCPCLSCQGLGSCCGRSATPRADGRTSARECSENGRDDTRRILGRGLDPAFEEPSIFVGLARSSPEARKPSSGAGSSAKRSHSPSLQEELIAPPFQAPEHLTLLSMGEASALLGRRLPLLHSFVVSTKVAVHGAKRTRDGFWHNPAHQVSGLACCHGSATPGHIRQRLP